MKQLYLLLIVLFSFNLSSSQDEILFGEWFLQSITTSGVQHDNYFGEIPINFTESNPLPDDDSIFTYDGGVCSPYTGNYSVFSNTITIYDLAELASCDYSTAHGKYWDKYRDIFSTDLTFQNLTYTIDGEGLDQILTIFSNNGDFIVYGKQIPIETIFKTWHSYSTETADGIIYPSLLDITTFEISPTFYNTPFGLEANANGGCNEFFGYHNIYDSNENEFDISNFNQTLIDCSEDNFYEPTYFSVLGNEFNGPFSYQLQDDGNTLVLTNSIGEILTFGEQVPPTNIIGQWYLYNMIVEGNQINNPNGSVPDIFFSTNPGDLLGFTLYGSGVCNGFQSDYYFNPQQSFNAEFISATLALCDTQEEELFENYYFTQVLSTGNNGSTELHYEITGTGDDASLVVTNLINGNQAFYGRQALSIDENEFNSSKISLNSNPVSNSIDISTNQNLSDSYYEIFSITGQRIINGTLNSSSINVNQLQSGLYFLKVSTNENVFETVKFIKD